MELQGPEQYRDKFAKEMLRFNRGGIVSSSPRLQSWDYVRSSSSSSISVIEKS